jgi:hypothetical protein
MPTASQTIEILEDSLSEVQHALGTAQHVLHVVDTTERTVRRARRNLKRALVLLLVGAVVGGVVFALRARANRPPDLDIER